MGVWPACIAASRPLIIVWDWLNAHHTTVSGVTKLR
jgi:hypothetical protein